MMRIAASIYLNSAPLVYSFSTGSRRRRTRFLGDKAPSRCAQMLEGGLCDAALIPVIEYLRIPDLLVVPRVAVASKQKVRSVLVASRGPLEDVRSVALDSSSRTSQTLLRVLFKHKYRVEPVFSERTPDASVAFENMFEGNDAALIIGDPAMRLAASAEKLGLKIYDLADEWRAMTGLPFVFAIWATNPTAIDAFPNLVREFQQAKTEGLDHLDEIVAHYSETLQLPQAELLSYLQVNVNFDLDNDNLAGMTHFFNLAEECGLAVNRKVEFA
ncbi:MAG: menaquinone biosynthesis protein [Acidobacteriota bacterium]